MKTKHTSDKLLPKLLKDDVPSSWKTVVYKLASLYCTYLPAQDELNNDTIIVAKNIKISPQEFPLLVNYVETKINFCMDASIFGIRK